MPRRRVKYGKPSKGKVRNATKVEADGIKFDSKLEYYMYQGLKKAKVKFEMYPHYTIISPFTYKGKKIRAMGYTSDFLLTDLKIVVETKGFESESWPLRRKIFLKYLVDNNIDLQFVQLKNKKEVDSFIENLKF